MLRCGLRDCYSGGFASRPMLQEFRCSAAARLTEKPPLIWTRCDRHMMFQNSWFRGAARLTTPGCRYIEESDLRLRIGVPEASS